MRSLEDANLVRRIRREMDKRQLDFTRTEVEADKGKIRFAGTITYLKDVKQVRVKTEMDELCLILSRMPEVRQVNCDARIVEYHPEEDEPRVTGLGSKSNRSRVA